MLEFLMNAADHEVKKHAVEFEKCLAYDVMKLKGPHMEQNPAYEEIKCMCT